MNTTELIIKTLFLALIGICFFFYEGIIIMDFFKSWGKWWSKSFFESNKDRNNDGKISWIERTFPRDGGHFFKRLLVALIGAAVTYYHNIPAEWYLLLIFIGWWIISALFDASWNFWTKFVQVLLLVSILCSCHTIKNSNKSNSQFSNSSDSSSKLNEVIEENIDTTIKTPEKKFEFNLSSSDTGIQNFSTPDFDLTIKNSGGKSKVNLNLKAKEIPVKLNRKTTRELQVNTNKKNKSKSNSIIKEKTSEAFKIPWWIWILISAIGFIYLSFKAQYS